VEAASPLLIFNMPLHAKEYGIAVLPLTFMLSTLCSSTSDEGRALQFPRHRPVRSRHNVAFAWKRRTCLNTATNP